jgi:NADH:ubiquinone oxidoreductase subunit 6 (subunit J)
MNAKIPNFMNLITLSSCVITLKDISEIKFKNDILNINEVINNLKNINIIIFKNYLFFLIINKCHSFAKLLIFYI